MPNAENAKLMYEAGQTPVAMTALTDQGDFKTFKSTATLWSARSGYVPSVLPNGVATGGLVSVAASGSNDVIDIAALTCYLAGTLTSVSASTDEAISRPAANDYQKFSITVTSGGAIAVVDGTEGTSFSDTRDAAGGPPLIPTTSIEIAQVWLSSQSSAPITASEIKQTPGVYREMYNYPTWDVVYGTVSNGVLGYAGVTFHSALAAIHTGSVGKGVYASYYTPDFAELVDAYDFVPPNNSHSISSKQVYGRTKGAKSSSLNQGSFSFDMQDGISDNILQYVDSNLWFKFYQNRLNSPYILSQGYLGIQQSFPAGDSITAACTVSAETAALRVTA